MKKRVIVVYMLSMAFVFQFCAPARYVKPLNKKEQALGFSFGGPVIAYSGLAIPIPFTTLSYAYGLHERLTMYGGLHLTSLAFGNIQTDLGVTAGLWQSKNMGLSLSAAAQLANGIAKKNTLRCWPSLDMNFYYQPGSKSNFVYGGIGTWVETASKRAHNIDAPRLLVPKLQVGYQLTGRTFTHQFELSYLAPGVRNLPGVVDYKGIAGTGALGIYYGIVKKF